MVKKIFNKISLVLLILLFAFAILSIITSLIITKTQKSNNFWLFNYSFLTVQTDSMEPNIKVNDMIIIKKVDNIESLSVGDVITFKFNSTELNTHRIVDFEGSLIITKGDNASGEDSPIEFSEVIGKVVVTSHFVGTVISILNEKLGFLLFILIPMLFFVIYESNNLRKRVKEYNEDKVLNSPEYISAQKIKIEREQIEKVIKVITKNVK